MKKMISWGSWAALYVLCLALSLLTKADSAVVFKNLAALAFFLPGIYLLLKGNRKDAAVIAGISAASLVLTLLCLVAGILTARSDSSLLTFLTALVSAPMLLCAFWAESLFLWACLLIGGLKKLGKK